MLLLVIDNEMIHPIFILKQRHNQILRNIINQILTGAVEVFDSFVDTKRLLKMSLCNRYSAPHFTGNHFEGSFCSIFAY